MDCRKPALLAFSLLVGVSGCLPARLTPLWPFARPEEEVATKDVETRGAAALEDAARKIHPKTMVAFAALREQQALEINQGQDQKDFLNEHARLAYQRALDLDPKYVPAHTGLGRLFERQGNLEQAQARFAQATKLAPRDPAILHEVGMYHARQKDFAPALHHLKRAHDLDLDNRQYSKDYGLCLARANQPDEAWEVLRKVMPEAEAHLIVAKMLRHLNDLERSKHHVQLALRASPTCGPAHRFLAELEACRTSPAPE